MNTRVKAFQKYCEDNGWKYKIERTMHDRMYSLEIVFPSSDTITASSTNIDQALDIIKNKLLEKLNNKGKK